MNTSWCCLEQLDTEQRAGNANTTSISSCEAEGNKNKIEFKKNPLSEHFLDSFYCLLRLLFRLGGRCERALIHAVLCLMEGAQTKTDD